jgi:hypothetical protein
MQDKGGLVTFFIVELGSLQAFHDLSACMVETGKIKADWSHSS